MDSDDGLLVGGVDGLEGLALGTLHPLAINVQAGRLIIGDAGGLDLGEQRHICGIEYDENDFCRGITMN